MTRASLQLRRRKLLVESPASATTDIAFILIIFFLVCASVQPDTGREQIIPRSEEQQDKSKQSQNIEVSISPAAVVVNSDIVDADALAPKLRTLLAGRESEADRVVIVNSAPNTSYQRWIAVTEQIDRAGGIVTL